MPCSCAVLCRMDALDGGAAEDADGTEGQTNGEGSCTGVGEEGSSRGRSGVNKGPWAN
jgi:hypothetical protein